MLIDHIDESSRLSAAHEIMAEQNRAIAKLSAALRVMVPISMIAAEMLNAVGEDDQSARVLEASRLASQLLDEIHNGKA